MQWLENKLIVVDNTAAATKHDCSLVYRGETVSDNDYTGIISQNW